MLNRRAARGMSLIEIAVTLAVLGTLLALGMPALIGFMHNSRIKSASEAVLAGVTLARAEAVRRNVAVRFQLVSDLTGSCALSATSHSWVVSLSDPTTVGCNAAPSDTTEPRIIQVRSAEEGTETVTVATTGGSSIVFNALGRMSGAGISKLVFRNPTGGSCEHEDTTSGTMRCLQIEISSGGQTKLCDPKVTDATDPRKCST